MKHIRWWLPCGLAVLMLTAIVYYATAAFPLWREAGGVLLQLTLVAVLGLSLGNLGLHLSSRLRAFASWDLGSDRE